MKRPRVTARASKLRPAETVVEFTFPDGTGGLMSFIDGRIELYRTDAGVIVEVTKDGKLVLHVVTP